MAQTDLLDVIDGLYAAALAPELWPHALHLISTAFEAVGTSMVPLGIADDMHALVSPELDAMKQAYDTRWWRHDTGAQRVISRGIGPGTVASDRQVMSEAEIRHDPFYQEFLHPNGVGELLAAIGSLGPGRMVSVAVHRPLRRDRFEPELVARMGRLTRHIERALTVSTALVEARVMASDLAGAVDQLSWGAVLLDGVGRLRQMNRAAEGLLGDGLSVRDGHLRARDGQDDARLHRAIGQALPGAPGAAAPSLLVRGADGRPQVQVDVVPVRPRTDALEFITLGAGGALVLMRGLETAPSGLVRQLLGLGLSPAEVRLAEALGRGGRLREIAAAQGIAYETTRSQLRSIFNKLGIGRQTELVALLARLGG